MAEYLIIEPDDLRRSAEQYTLFAERLRAWGEVPQAWLDECPAAYGTFFAPMHQSLVECYADRQQKTERLAVKNERARDLCLKSADELEAADEDSGRQIDRVGEAGFDNHDSGPTPLAV